MKSMESLLDTRILTVSGKTLGENLSTAEIKDEKVIRPLQSPRQREGGFAILKGNLGIS